MILVFGGTTEGKKAISLLNEMQLSFVYSTKTNFPVEAGEYGIHRYGALDERSLKSFLQSQQVKAIIHASHPFAEELTRTIQEVSEELSVPVIKWSRNETEFPKDEDIHLVDGYQEALNSLGQLKIECLLALTGVQSIDKLRSYWKRNTAFFRILDRAESKELAEKSRFPKDQLILGYPNKSVEEECALIREKRIDGVLTKDSGVSGSLDVKIQACSEAEIPLIVLKRPEIPSSYTVVRSSGECKEQLSNQRDLWG